MSIGVNHNLNGENHVKWSESQYRRSESHQVICSLVKPNIGFFSHVKSRRMIDGGKTDIEGVNHEIDGAKCQVV